MVAEEYQKQPPEVFYKKLFLTTSQNSQENTCVGVSWATASRILKLLFVSVLVEEGKITF